jgi:iron-sulfur cluster repair protein YtfE (RIC family)
MPNDSEITPPLEPTPQGEALYEELRWVHSMIRRDLEIVQRLETEVENGLSAHDVRAEISELKTNGPLWRLKMGCLSYCRFVHSHHRLEDLALFPALRRTNPEIGPIVDRLEADHRRVAELLTHVETGAEGLDGAEPGAARKALATSLGELAEHLLAHLELEEREVAPTMKAMTGI